MPSTKIIARKFGIEMEGYVNHNPSTLNFIGAKIKRDSSLRNSNWGNDFSSRDYARDYGVEIVTDPIKDLRIVERVFSQMELKGWHVDNRAGTHVHIDISDYSEYDKAKLIRFCKGIERIIFMFVKDYRSDNRYCQKLQDEWRNIFKEKMKTSTKRVQNKHNYGYTTITETKNENTVNWEKLKKRRTGNLIDELQSNGFRECANSKYFWLNIFGSRFSTAEFRIFHAVESAKEATDFIQMAHNIVDIVKHSSIEQLEFMIMSLYESKDVESLRKNFLSIVSIDTSLNLFAKGTQAKLYMKEILEKNFKHRTEEAKRLMEIENNKKISAMKFS
jgi:hypothetical protein